MKKEQFDALKTFCELSRDLEGSPVVIAGDFNVSPSNNIVKDFNNVMKNATQHAESVDTHESYNDWGARLLTLDYIYYDGFSKCHSYDVVTEESHHRMQYNEDKDKGKCCRIHHQCV